MVKVAGDTSTCPPPESVTMEQTVTERKRQGESPEKEISSMVAREERNKKNNTNNTRQNNQVQSHASAAEGKKRHRLSGGCARACDRSLSRHHSCTR